jgi:hypothetical protein
MIDASLTDIVVLNESRDEARAGDVSVFRSANEACAYLEHWWVEDGEGFAFTASGDRLGLGVDSAQRVVVLSREAVPDGAEIVRGWLHAYAAAVLEARRSSTRSSKAKPHDHEVPGHLPSSTDDLIACVGFNR